LTPRKLPDGFLLGCATAAHQVEGGIDNDWSRWTAEHPEAILGGGDATVAIDHYRRYREDLAELASRTPGMAGADLVEVHARRHNALRPETVEDLEAHRRLAGSGRAAEHEVRNTVGLHARNRSCEVNRISDALDLPSRFAHAPGRFPLVLGEAPKRPSASSGQIAPA